MEILKHTQHIARKEYDCDASYQIFNQLGLTDFTEDEQKIILKHKLKNFKILPGEKYDYFFIIDNGEHWDFRAIPEMLTLYYKYECYEY